MSLFPLSRCSGALAISRHISHVLKRNADAGVEIHPLRVKAISQQHRMVRKAHSSPQGFTLVEVVLAIGIIALAFVPVLGLLPVGANVAREAIDTTVEAQITQFMTNQAQQTDFSRLPDLSTVPTQYFDYQGNKTEVKDAIYEASFNVVSSTALPGNTSTSKLATVTICILNSKSKGANADPDPMKNPAAKKSVILIPDNGR